MDPFEGTFHETHAASRGWDFRNRRRWFRAADIAADQTFKVKHGLSRNYES
jgi:hypothetical protein